MRAVKIEHRIGVRASAEAIWDVLADIEAWPNWCSLYSQVAGAIRIGARLELTVALAGQAPRQIRPVVVDWVPHEQLHWRLSMLGGLVRSIRYFEIEELAPGSCIFSNGEMFEGLLGARIAKRLRGPIQAGFREMGEALKARVEKAADQAAAD